MKFLIHLSDGSEICVDEKCKLNDRLIPEKNINKLQDAFDAEIEGNLTIKIESSENVYYVNINHIIYTKSVKN